eukprot:10506999-Heterocapsa_arctica.AAC.1
MWGTEGRYHMLRPEFLGLGPRRKVARFTPGLLPFAPPVRDALEGKMPSPVRVADPGGQVRV